jgi:DNA-binding NarL/FixJ family response regulator
VKTLTRKARAILADVEDRLAAHRRACRAAYPRADQPWTSADERRLARAMARGATPQEAGRRLGRTENAIRARWSELLRCRSRQFVIPQP